jgi:uncharacterized membrane protein YgdD (TMEM256/DUF423 family)
MDTLKTKRWLALAALLAALYVLLSAFGAHALSNSLTNSDLTTYQTGLRYLIIHALGLLLVNFIAHSLNKSAGIVNLFFVLGVLFFSFGLIIHACRTIFGFDFNTFALIAPIGGLSFIVGWIGFAVIILKK